MKKIIPLIVIILILVAGALAWNFSKKETPLPVVINFDECVKLGNPVMESYPRQCRHGSQTFTESIGNELEKSNFIRVDYPRPNQSISSPLVIRGEARGNWFFEASFPVVLTDWDGKIIAQGIATAKADWMTTDFVPYEARLNFEVDKNIYSNKGTLILQKDNPSGLPENDDALEIPVIFADAVGEVTSNNTGIAGVVMSGPTCPVMQNPPDPKCDDKPIRTNISVYPKSDISRSIAMLNSETDGTFKVSLPPGEYVVMAGSFGVPFPRCSDTSATVASKGFTEIVVSCDTGIR